MKTYSEEGAPGWRLVRWYADAGRDLPWRQTRDPYRVWISEIILQQTRVAQGLGYYERFVARFPTVERLAAAPQDDVLKMWEGLGYYSRARNLHKAAQEVVEKLGGKFPQTAAELEELPGIGPYTSRAIASLCFDEQTAVLDGNVFRVLARLHADGTPINRPAARKHFQALADGLLGTAPAAQFNQAVMDLGATVCTPTRPRCVDCPLQTDCKALKQNTQEDYPVKDGKAERKETEIVFYLVRLGGDRFYIRQRNEPHQKLWRGLWELPNSETVVAVTGSSRKLLSLRHELTHKRLILTLHEVEASAYAPHAGDVAIGWDEVARYAFSRAVLRLFEELGKPAAAPTLFDQGQ